MSWFWSQMFYALTLTIGHAEPQDKSNLLPAPDSPFYLVLHLYSPEEKVLAGQWQHPPLKKGEA